jgi:hypothetical protein
VKFTAEELEDIGDIEFTQGDNSVVLKCNMLARYGSSMLFASVTGNAGDIKAARAIINSNTADNGRTTIACARPKVCKPKAAGVEEYYNRPHQPGRIFPRGGGYRTEAHRLEYDKVHAMFISKDPGFMIRANEAALWAILKSPSYTTPMLREWLPYVQEQLIKEGMLEYCDCAPATLECALMSATSADVDKIVTRGLEEYRIVIPTKKREDAAA